jgi:hypothetical protein
LAALAVAGLSGCCCEPWGGCYPCGNNWCGPSCGELFWCEWFSIPPQCCDPCDECGNFIGPRLNDGLYSHGNDYQGWCEHRHAHHVQQPTVAEPVQGAPSQPSPAPPGSPDPEPYTLPGPDADAPEEMPLESSMRVGRGDYAQRVSYEAPQRRRQVAPAPERRLLTAIRQPMVDSRAPSRTLAKPPRTRLFSR